MTGSLYRPPAGSDGVNKGYAEDVQQFADVLQGQRDGGALSLLGALSSPAAPTSVNTSSSGSITGTNYQWGIYWITGIQYVNTSGVFTQTVTGRTPYGTLSGAVSLSSKQAVVSISGLTVPTGAIGWGVVRNKSGGGTWYEVPGASGSGEQFLTQSGSMPVSFTDNQVDSALLVTGPTSNTTGTSLTGGLKPAYLAPTAESNYSTTSGALVQCGYGTTWKLTPVSTGLTVVSVAGFYACNAGGGNQAYLNATYGTVAGGVPTAGAAQTGTGILTSNLVATSNPAAFYWVPFGFSMPLPLTAGTAYWFDLCIAAQAGTTDVDNVTVAAWEVK